VIAGLRSRDPEVAAESKKRELPKLLEQIERLTEYRTSRRELMKRKLSGVIRRAVSKGFRVPERQLH
jgi:phage gpG-like protein